MWVEVFAFLPPWTEHVMSFVQIGVSLIFFLFAERLKQYAKPKFVRLLAGAALIWSLLTLFAQYVVFANDDLQKKSAPKVSATLELRQSDKKFYACVKNHSKNSVLFRANSTLHRLGLMVDFDAVSSGKTECTDVALLTDADRYPLKFKLKIDYKSPFAEQHPEIKGISVKREIEVVWDEGEKKKELF